MPEGVLSQQEKVLYYISHLRSYLNMEAIFSDETENYVQPNEPMAGDIVTIHLRTARGNVDGVSLHWIAAAEARVIPMTKVTAEVTPQAPVSGMFDFYSVSVTASPPKISYFFSLEKQSRVYYYNKCGVSPDADPSYHFSLITDFVTPDWAKGAVMYQIYVDRFRNACPENDVTNNEYVYLGKAAKRMEKWDAPTEQEDICNFYGGDLQGVMEKLDYLADLGVEVLYFNPVFVSPSNHKYDIQDYDHVDPHLAVIKRDGGEPLRFEKFQNRYATRYIRRTTDQENLEASNAYLAELIEAAHAKGIKVILDGVFNHCGAFNKWLDKESFYSGRGYPIGAYRRKQSPYHHYFKWYDSNWPNNDCYDCWWGHDNHPKLNYEASEELYQYMLGVARKWVSPPLNADGWRLDVAADLGSAEEFNHQFWKDFRKAVKQGNPSAIILAEHYGDPYRWLQGDEWDTIMNYDAFMEPITWFLTGMEKHSEAYDAGKLNNAMAFEEAMRYHMARMNIHALQTAMNELSNHDHSRFLTRTNRTVGRLHTKGAEAADSGVNAAVMMEAVVFQMTWPGAPTIYYGDEAGLTGWTDPDNRRTYPWGRENKALLEFYRECVWRRRENEALRSGSLLFLYTDYGILSYGRWNTQEKIAVILNNNDMPKRLKIPVWKMECALNGEMELLIGAAGGSWWRANARYPVADGILSLELDAFGCMILRETETALRG
jgi:alpha-glucosidase